MDDEIVTRLADQLKERSLRLAVAESLTGGMLASSLAAGEDASEWFLGGVVAYATSVKQRVLRVSPGPVVSEDAAREMVRGVADLLGADVALAVTGAGGPDGQDGAEPGTVWMAVRGPRHDLAKVEHFDGDPEQVCRQTCTAALHFLTASLDQLTSLDQLSPATQPATR